MDHQQIPNYPDQSYGVGPQADLEGRLAHDISTASWPASSGSPTERDALRGPSGSRLEVVQSDSVYSAITFLPAISRIKTGKETNRAARLALALVCLNAVLQTGVVWVISVYDNSARRADIQSLLMPNEVADYGEHALSDVDKATTESAGQAEDAFHRSMLLPNERKELEAAESISPLCHRHRNGDLTCMPASVKFVHEWDALDFDGDGVWTIEEARADSADLKRKYGISPETIFNNLINGLRMSRDFAESKGRNRSFYLIPDVDNERAVPKAYFNYWAGDAMMCSFFDSNSCEAVAKAGVFEAALKPGRVSAHAKQIYDLDSAIQYCYRMLSPAGGCENLLPIDFKSNREQRWGRCGKRSLIEGGKYTNPYNPDQSVHILQATYSSVSAYQRATSRLFLLFLCLIIMLWFLAMVDEWRELLKFGEFLIVYPGVQPGTRGGEMTQEEPDSEEGESANSYRIKGLSKAHRALLAVIYVIRFTVAMMLLSLGTRFLLLETSYVDLVLNSLALTFILEIDSVLYTLMDKKTTEEIDNCKKLTFRTRLPSAGCLGYTLKKECWGLFLIPTLSVCIVLFCNQRDKMPVLEALNCACIQEGERCLDSMKYQADWWRNYWSHILPHAMHHIEEFRMPLYQTSA